MSNEAVKNYQKAGKIHQEAVKIAKKMAKPGVKLLEIAEKVEGFIFSQPEKAGCAFPINLSLNHEAAHYTPSVNDKTELSEKDVLKVDIGVHVQGYIVDSAFTVDLSGKWGKLVESTEKALDNAVSILERDLEVSKIGAAIENTIKESGFNVVKNLSGHGVAQWEAHVPPSVPNYDNRDTNTLKDGFAFAIEPFATDGEGWVRESPKCEIFELRDPKPVRNKDARKIIELVSEKYSTLPFAERWVVKELDLSEFAGKVAFRELLMKKCLVSFPVLKEEEGKTVAQTEGCFIVDNGKILRLDK